MTLHHPAYKILTWGCQMNDDDSQQMSNLLEQIGYREAATESKADIILLNTCSVRAKPEQKVKSKLGELRALKEKKPGLIIGVCGCMAQREGKELLNHASPVDLVIGTASIYELPMLIEQVRQDRGRIVADRMPERGKLNGSAHVARTISHVGLKAFVPVMYGCNNFCTYCVVPSARGPERSRSPQEIVAEITEMVSLGCRGVTLVGQNVNSYAGRSEQSTVNSERGGAGPDSHSSLITHHEGVDFAELLKMVNEIEGLKRIRFTTSHPKDLSDRLIHAMAELPKVCEHLHLPIQSGDDDILDRMGRKYTVEHYLKLVDKLRARIPGIALTTDVMVAFPGETHEQFKNTINTVGEIRYDAAFMFAFNPRPGTAAEKMDGQHDNTAKTRRLIELIAVQNEITLEKNQDCLESVFEVLVEGPSVKDPEKLSGYTRTHKTVNFPGSPDLIGKLVMVRAKTAHPWGFTGEMVNGSWLMVNEGTRSDNHQPSTINH